jgi:3-oxoacyl-[acyl-carrier protein] reductase
MDLGLAGERVIVTGGTRGIGRSIAETFAQGAADVAICARSAEDVAATVEALAATGVRATGRTLDVGDGPPSGHGWPMRPPSWAGSTLW